MGKIFPSFHGPSDQSCAMFRDDSNYPNEFIAQQWAIFTADKWQTSLRNNPQTY
jgi:hypothetical protein